MNWNQTGMPSAFISRLGQKRELGEFKSVLTDARNHVLQPIDVANLERRGIDVTDDPPPDAEVAHGEPSDALPSEKPKSQADGLAEWEEWDRRFRSLLD